MMVATLIFFSLMIGAIVTVLGRLIEMNVQAYCVRKRVQKAWIKRLENLQAKEHSH